MYLYVSNSPANSTHQISAWSVGSNGALTPVSGSPFSASGYLGLAAKDSTLFAADGYHILSFAIASDGSIKQESSLNAGQMQNGQPVGGPTSLFFDPKQANLYSYYAELGGTDTGGYGAYNFNPSNGQVTPINTAGGTVEDVALLAFSANDQFAWTSSAYHGDSAISGFTRASNGALTANTKSSFPSPAAPSGTVYEPVGAAADGSNHVIIAMGQATNDSFSPNGPWQLAVYTFDNTGTLTTTSTYKNMTTLNVGDVVNWYAFSPDDQYFAVGGSGGLQLFSYNSANATFTALGGQLNTDKINYLTWDQSDRLYAVSTQGNNLYVYNVTAGGAKAASGSPYSVQGPQSIAVATPTSSSSGS